MIRCLARAANGRPRLHSFTANLLLAFLPLWAAGCGDFFPALLGLPDSLTSSLLRWNQIAVDASGLDHTPVGAGETRQFGHQLGPTRASRAMAIVHIAVFDAVNAVKGNFQSYTGIDAAPVGSSPEAAVAQAAHDALVALFPSQSPTFDAELQKDLDAIGNTTARANGVGAGQAAAAAILALRTNDGSDLAVPYVFSMSPGAWRVDPINPGQTPLGEEWPAVRPFVLTRADQFRVPPPPSLSSAEYTAAYNEVKMLGGDGIVTPTARTTDETMTGLFWAYDGTPSLCAPPRLYNQIATNIANTYGISGEELARLLALVNVSMADAGIAIWESKYYYNFWRPVTGIRESDVGTGPTGLGDGNPDTTGDPTYVPLCAPASNLAGPNFTPPFPAYPSGHAGFGGALFETLRNYFGTDDVAFTVTSDEFNGLTRDIAGNVRPLLPRSYSKLSQAEEENGQSRIYLGIHWKFDKVEGIHQGRRVADAVFESAFQRVR